MNETWECKRVEVAGLKAARESTVTARPRQETGCRYSYQDFHARAVASIARWASEFGGYPGRKNRRFGFMSKGHMLGLFDLSSSYPLIKRAVDITSVKRRAMHRHAADRMCRVGHSVEFVPCVCVTDVLR